MRANGAEVLALITYGRLFCIPFSLLGAFFSYRWATDLYGPNAGITVIALYVFEPNLLAHGELITPDAACTALGIVACYCYWRWLKHATWARAGIAGITLGLAILSKLSWLILFPLWPLMWAYWQATQPRNSLAQSHIAPTPHAPFIHLCGILLISVYCINAAYGFEGFGQPLGSYQFVSTSMAGVDHAHSPDNRFRMSVVGHVPVPFPVQFVRGIDAQKRDFEGFDQKSYLLGEWKDSGWWYYYLYAFAIKIPLWTLALFCLVVCRKFFEVSGTLSIRDEVVLVLPAIAFIGFVSAESGFSIHFRYAFPALAMALIFISQVGQWISLRHGLRSASVVICLVGTVTTTIASYPYHFAYFNCIAGGREGGHKHLLGSSVDWGQGLKEAVNWIHQHEPNMPLELVMPQLAVGTVMLNTYGIRQFVSYSPSDALRLALYSAERFEYEFERPQNHSATSVRPHHVVKRFPSGMILIRLGRCNRLNELLNTVDDRRLRE